MKKPIISPSRAPAGLLAVPSGQHAVGAETPALPLTATVNRRHFLARMTGAALIAAVDHSKAFAALPQDTIVNLAKVAVPSASYSSGDSRLSALNDGFVPDSSHDRRRGAYGNWPRTEIEWVQYEWSKPVTTNSVEVYWWVDGMGISAPASYRVTYWNGALFVPVSNPTGLGVETNRFNRTTFDAVQTDKLRLEITSDNTLQAFWSGRCTAAVQCHCFLPRSTQA